MFKQRPKSSMISHYKNHKSQENVADIIEKTTNLLQNITKSRRQSKIEINNEK